MCEKNHHAKRESGCVNISEGLVEVYGKQPN
jgi:hypothetical protein